MRRETKRSPRHRQPHQPPNPCRRQPRKAWPRPWSTSRPPRTPFQARPASYPTTCFIIRVPRPAGLRRRPHRLLPQRQHRHRVARPRQRLRQHPCPPPHHRPLQLQRPARHLCKWRLRQVCRQRSLRVLQHVLHRSPRRCIRRHKHQRRHPKLRPRPQRRQNPLLRGRCPLRQLHRHQRAQQRRAPIHPPPPVRADNVQCRTQANSWPCPAPTTR